MRMRVSRPRLFLSTSVTFGAFRAGSHVSRLSQTTLFRSRSRLEGAPADDSQPPPPPKDRKRPLESHAHSQVEAAPQQKRTQTGCPAPPVLLGAHPPPAPKHRCVESSQDHTAKVPGIGTNPFFKSSPVHNQQHINVVPNLPTRPPPPP